MHLCKVDRSGFMERLREGLILIVCLCSAMQLVGNSSNGEKCIEGKEVIVNGKIWITILSKFTSFIVGEPPVFSINLNKFAGKFCH